MAFIVADEIERYALDHTTAPPAHLQAVWDDTHANVAAPQMMTGPLEGRFLEFLVYALQPRTVLEIGTFTGYGALSMAAALPAGGRVITCELDSGTAAIARRNIEASPYADRVEVRVGPALETLRTLDGPFDLVFIDADKTSYLAYLREVLPLLSDRGLVAVDNTLWSGRVVDETADDESTKAIREVNDWLVEQDDLVVAQLTVRDGITLVRKRS